MDVFMPEKSHVVALAFLGTGFLLLVAFLALAGSLWRGNLMLARRAFLGGALIGAGYLLLVLAFSFASKESVLAAGDWKYFCELDCHTAYTVTEVRQAKTLGSGEQAVTASGTFYVVTLKAWFDPNTISPRRGDFPLFPNARSVLVLDAQRRRFGPSLAGQRALETPAARLVPLAQSLRPGDSYETTFVFDLPADARHPRLLLTDPSPVNRVLIGHENSLFHKKVYFRVDVTPLSQATL
ncbi:MAG TPA: hypothetical protein VNL38_02850 [Candidatus Nitrosotenuis sp.]|nr:hypothetical protein [Candidatus Nitrosotenuis sp.]